MPPRAPREFMLAVRTHRNRLERVLTAQAVGRMRRLYDEAQGQVVARLRRLAGTSRKDSFTAHQQRIVLAQLRQGQALVAQRMAGDMRPLSRAAQERSLRGLASDVKRLHRHFTGAEISLPVEEAATFARVVQGRESSLLRLHQASMQRYGANIVRKTERELALTLLRGDSPAVAMDKVAELIDGEWWQGERIVRTELAYAYNQAHRDGVAESAGELPELRQRWEEHCDEQGRPLDDRVSVDSVAMHGQVAPAGGRFTMPPDAPFPGAGGETEVPPRLVGLSWDAPPNRPNDRAVLAPWMARWGVPGWEWRGGQRLWLVR